MTVRSLEEEFRRMGLSEEETRRSLGNMGMLNEGAEAGVDDDSEAGEDFEETFLSNDGEDDEVFDDEDLDEGMGRIRTHKTSAAHKRRAKQYYKSHKMQIGRKRKKRAKSSAGKRAAELLARMPKGGARVRRVVSDRDVPAESGIHEDILGELGSLAEAIQREPKSRFDEFVEAFNYIADLGELLALRAITEDEDEEAAEIVIGLSVNAEDILREMDEMGGAVTPEEDELLSATLEEALEDAEAALEAFDLVEEEEDDSEDDFEEDFEDDDSEDEDLEEDSILAIAQQLREADKGPKSQPRPKKAAKRKLLAPGKTISVKGASAWGKKHGKGASKAQIRGRKDVRNKEALLNYLKMVKAGHVAPGQKVNKGAVKAKRMAGKGYKGKAKAG